MPIRQQTVLEDLNHALAAHGDDFCLPTLERVTHLVVGKYGQIGEQHVTVFDAGGTFELVLGRLPSHQLSADLPQAKFALSGSLTPATAQRAKRNVTCTPP